MFESVREGGWICAPRVGWVVNLTHMWGGGIFTPEPPTANWISLLSRRYQPCLRVHALHSSSKQEIQNNHPPHDSHHTMATSAQKRHIPATFKVTIDNARTRPARFHLLHRRTGTQLICLMHADRSHSHDSLIAASMHMCKRAGGLGALRGCLWS